MRAIFVLCLFLILSSSEAAAAPLRACLRDSTGKIVIRKKCPPKKGFTELDAEVLQGLGATQLGPPGPAGPQGPVGQSGTPATKLFAAVRSSGMLYKSSGVVSAAKIGTGRYDVVFNSDISSCVALANVGLDTSSLVPAVVSTSIGFSGANNTVRVRIYSNDTSVEFDRDFYLALFC